MPASRGKFRVHSYESLESRLPLAGQVTVTFDVANGNITLVGDGLGNEVKITQTAPGEQVYEGLNGTLFIPPDDMSGGGGGGGMQMPVPMFMISGVGGNMTINLNAGDDIVEMEGVECGGILAIEMSVGADTVMMTETKVNRSANIDTGDGIGMVLIDTLESAEALTITGGINADTIHLLRALLNSTFTVTAGNSANEVILDDVQSRGPSSITTGNGADTIKYINSISNPDDNDIDGDITITAGTRANDVEVNNCNIAGRLTISGGADSDTVYIANSFLLLATTVTMGNGTNACKVTNFFSSGDLNRGLFGNLLISGGTGIDDVYVGLYISVAETMPLDGDIDGDGIPDGGIVILNGVLSVQTSAGLDTIFVGLFDSLDLTIDSGGGSDEVDVYNGTVLGLTRIETSTTVLSQMGADFDILRIAYLNVIGNLLINTGVGSDLVSFITSSVPGSTGINTGAGGDTVAMLIHNLGDLTIITSTGSDTVKLDNVLTFGALRIDTSDNIDFVFITGCTASSLDLSLGGGEDRAVILTSIIDSIFASLGDGEQDEMILSISVVDTNLVIDGGAGGRDIFSRYNSNLPRRQTVFNVEFAS